MNDFGDLGVILGNTSDLVCSCLEETPNGAPGTCTVYWSTIPDDFDCDCGAGGLLAVWVESMPVVNKWPNPYTGPVGNGIPLTLKADIAVRLVRPCWPGLKSSIATPVPTRSETEPPALDLTYDATRVMCCVLQDLMSSAPVITGGPCLQKTVPVLTVDRNRSLCAGFTVRFSVGLGACCVPPEGS